MNKYLIYAIVFLVGIGLIVLQVYKSKTYISSLISIDKTSAVNMKVYEVNWHHGLLIFNDSLKIGIGDFENIPYILDSMDIYRRSKPDPVRIFKKASSDTLKIYYKKRSSEYLVYK